MGRCMALLRKPRCRSTLAFAFALARPIDCPVVCRRPGAIDPLPLVVVRTVSVVEATIALMCKVALPLRFVAGPVLELLAECLALAVVRVLAPLHSVDHPFLFLSVWLIGRRRGRNSSGSPVGCLGYHSSCSIAGWLIGAPNRGISFNKRMLAANSGHHESRMSLEIIVPPFSELSGEQALEGGVPRTLRVEGREAASCNIFVVLPE